MSWRKILLWLEFFIVFYELDPAILCVKYYQLRQWLLPQSRFITKATRLVAQAWSIHRQIYFRAYDNKVLLVVEFKRRHKSPQQSSTEKSRYF